MKKIITLCILILLTAVGYGSQPQQPDYNKLMLAKGFPADYAEKLAVLKKRWSQWVFEPLFISRMEKRYTWDHVLFMETDQSPRRSLISGSRHFAAYFHNSDLKEYDTGCRRASRAAVAYFLDPRNFLNERDIFQFEKLSFSDTVNTDTVRLALKGTFMEKGILENGKSYAEWLCIIGRELNINALFLACRIRQEQGLHGSPLVSGRCGDLLADYYRNNIQTQGRFQVLTPSSGFEIKTLEQLNGFYNYFNIEACGSGRFAIYLNGMLEAVKGSPAMAEKWGKPDWNTRWKALYGGAMKIAGSYTGNYQNTRYLQKWNVDIRSRTAKGGSKNFWGQYMQNIGAAFSESKTAYAALKRHGLLDMPRKFLIPVYSNMPAEPSPDPAQGRCRFYRAYQAQQRMMPSNFSKQ